MLDLKAIKHTFDVGDGKDITIETGKLARQAHGSCLVRMGKAAMLATVVSGYEPRVGATFFPLSVDYQEKFSSAGRIPGGFFKREGKLSDYEVLISRLVDRAIRPLFPDEYYHDTQVILSLISSDPEVMPDALTALATSTALTISDIPFQGPISEVRVARVDGAYIVNPTRTELKSADMDLIVAADMDNLMMVEGEMQECSEEDMVEALRVAHEAIKIQCQAQLDLLAALPNEVVKREILPLPSNDELKAKVEAMVKEAVYEVAKGKLDKKKRKEGFKAIKEQLKEDLAELVETLPSEEQGLVSKYYSKTEKKVIRDMMLDDKMRLDGRAFNEVRDLFMEVDFLESPHGVALFTRGETQALCTVTLGTIKDEQMLDKAYGKEFTRFILHYNFPAFSVGETKPMRGPGRREVGHGNLAMRSLKQVMPTYEESNYTIRIISDVLESNGSSSMATVCGGSLALMDAGVPIKTGVSGIAMGMIADPEDPTRYAILSDILGDEDHLGDMDFKVTGTENGICACQMDIKIDGLSFDQLREALAQAKEGRMHILNQMNDVISASREDFKDHAPRFEKFSIKPEYIGAIIGPGGKHIQELQKETGTNINIEEIDDRGVVTIFGTEKEGITAAVARIKAICSEPEEGEIYESIVKSIMPYGAFVEFMPGKQGLLHISEVSWERLDSMDGVFSEGETIQVKLLGVDPKNGKYKLSRKVLLDKPDGYVERSRERRDDRRGGDRRGGDRRDDRRGGDRRDDRRGGDRRDGGYDRRPPRRD